MDATSIQQVCSRHATYRQHESNMNATETDVGFESQKITLVSWLSNISVIIGMGILVVFCHSKKKRTYCEAPRVAAEDDRGELAIQQRHASDMRDRVLRSSSIGTG